MPYFESWWQAIVFGIVNLTAMLVIANLFTVMWKKYEDKLERPEDAQKCEANHHH